MRRPSGWVLVLVANALFLCVLSFYRTSEAAKPPVEPFANSVQQRMDMIAHLKEIRDLLKEQNALLRSGTLKVVVAEPGKK